MAKVDYSNVTLDKIYDYQSQDYNLAVFGYCFGKIPKHLMLNDVNLQTIQRLNFDGAYVAFFEDNKTDTQIVFRSHIDTFSLFYTEKDDTLYFSDDFYSLIKYISSATWNLDSVADYFEAEWNNIAKYDRSPLCEIHRLDTWRYMLLSADKKPVVENWKNLPSDKIYTIDNMEEFKSKFFAIIDYYLNVVREKYSRLAFTVSGGIDTNILAARYSYLYPDDHIDFFTSKFDDVNDESHLAAYMQKCLSSKISYVPVEITDLNLLERLYNYICKYTPPRFFNELSEEVFCENFIKSGLDNVCVNGYGADLTFGGFSCEYLPLLNEFLDQNRVKEAFDVFIAIQASFVNNTANLAQLFYNYCMNHATRKMQDKLVKYWGILRVQEQAGGGVLTKAS